MTITPTGEAVDGVGLPTRPDDATADPDPRRRTIRVISVFVQSPKHWRSDVAKFSRGYHDGSRPDLQGGEAARIRAAAATAALWGIPVGIVTGVREEEA